MHNTHTHEGTRRDTYLAHAVICEFNVSLRVEQHIVQFEISVDDAALVEVVERQTDLCRIESEGEKKQQQQKHSTLKTHKLEEGHVTSVSKPTWRALLEASVVSACGT